MDFLKAGVPTSYSMGASTPLKNLSMLVVAHSSSCVESLLARLVLRSSVPEERPNI